MIHAPTTTRLTHHAISVLPKVPFPAEAAWARYVLLAIIWFFVIAVLTGPIEQWLASRKRQSPANPQPRW